jgi:hypothetical protein
MERALNNNNNDNIITSLVINKIAAPVFPFKQNKNQNISGVPGWCALCRTPDGQMPADLL